MKILYGVQGTGNGHISRASAMLAAFKNHPELDVTWLLSGRDKSRGCGDISTFEWRAGFTFATENGRVNMLKTARCNNLLHFWRDISTLELDGYDMLITDFEPVLAHAARKRGLPVVGLGHQYAFRYPIPLRGSNPLVKGLMDHFAPAQRSVGLHWHHFDQPILPPIIDLKMPELMPVTEPDKIIVYLPFENLDAIQQMCSHWLDYEFYIYHPQAQQRDAGNLHLRSISREGFKLDLLSCSKVITNSGFELISECLQLGKAILVKPLHGQMEQLSNAAALSELNYATVVDELKPQAIRAWLKDDSRPLQLTYPDVACALARWIAGGCKQSEAELASELWQ
ncbi:MAG: MJ1255/VC2487 family glycosyltransferase [Gammaproteobacteria bacterium]